MQWGPDEMHLHKNLIGLSKYVPFSLTWDTIVYRDFYFKTYFRGIKIYLCIILLLISDILSKVGYT